MRLQTGQKRLRVTDVLTTPACQDKISQLHAGKKSCVIEPGSWRKVQF